jgi:regulator of protease activity HflC (stomatin/prohibitin superfamily)
VARLQSDQQRLMNQTLTAEALTKQYLEVLHDMKERYKSSPIEFLSVDIGDIIYPDVVVQSVIRKFVTNEDNERKDIELRIAQREIDIGVAEAEGVADAQKIIRTTLDPMFLQYEALEAIEQLSDAPNTTFIISPMNPGGNAPTAKLNSMGAVPTTTLSTWKYGVAVTPSGRGSGVVKYGR